MSPRQCTARLRGPGPILMRNVLSTIGCAVTSLLLAAAAFDAMASERDMILAYPPAARSDQVDTYNSTRVADPYRWLEDIDSTETRAWVEAEAKLSNAYLAAIPGRDAIARRLTKIWNHERWSEPFHRGRHWFFTHNDGLQNQAVLFVTKDLKAKPRILLDPNTLSKDGTVALKGGAVTDNGKLLAYGLSDAGSDWEILRVRDIATGKDLADEIRWAKFTLASWRKDDSGFYYSGYDAPTDSQILKAANQYHKLFFHKLGTPQSQDALIYTRTDDPGWYIGAEVTDDGRYLII